MASIFTRIINRELPATIVYEDEEIIAIRDIHPQAPVHVLIIPKQEIHGLSTLPDHGPHERLLNVAKKIAEQEGLTNGYRIVLNEGEDAGQTIDHLHAHLMGGGPLGHLG